MNKQLNQNPALLLEGAGFLTELSLFSMAQTSTYQDLLHPWAIYRQTEPAGHICIARFRKRSDAEGHLSILRQTIPTGKFSIVYDA